jgi:hypothetical protein
MTGAPPRQLEALKSAGSRSADVLSGALTRQADAPEVRDPQPVTDRRLALRALVFQAALELGLPSQLAEEVALQTPADPRRPGRLLVASDLDRTLVYSAQALGLNMHDEHAPRLVVAEVYQGAPISFHTMDTDLMLTALAQAAELVPVTTRTRAQYERVRLPAQPRYAIVANGGHILEAGVPDREWSASLAARLESACAPLAEIIDHLQEVTDPLWLLKSRVAEDLFAYLVVERALLPATFMAELTGWCALRGWSVSLQGRKVYCVPDLLTKSGAVAEVARRSGAVLTAAAGDSLLDADMLAAADVAVRPAHGELHDVGWLSANLRVTTGSGVFGGQEVCARLLALALAVDGG